LNYLRKGTLNYLMKNCSAADGFTRNTANHKPKKGFTAKSHFLLEAPPHIVSSLSYNHLT
jgi:hypothetical protein